MRPLPEFSSAEILRLRPNVERPEPGTTALGVALEAEASDKSGSLAKVLTVLLRGSECTFRCLMCDLWKHTHLATTPLGAIPAQIAAALRQPAAPVDQPPTWIKLYNASNFFAPSSVPTADLPRIADQLGQFKRVIVENHPRIRSAAMLEFRDSIDGRLEVAMGLESAHPQTLAALNKNMTLKDFRNACDWLISRDIDVRSFVLLKPPGMCEREAIEWCVRSVEFAHAQGVRHVSIIPLRFGNGAVEHLALQNLFSPPQLASLEEALSAVIHLPNAVITADLWDWQQLPGAADEGGPSIHQRIQRINLEQVIAEPTRSV